MDSTPKQNSLEYLLERLRKLSQFALAAFLCAFLVGIGFAAAQHNCFDTAHHDADHCVLCSLASTSAEFSPTEASEQRTQ
jgi:hypothetical protein